MTHEQRRIGAALAGLIAAISGLALIGVLAVGDRSTPCPDGWAALCDYEHP